jgi:hypothetical protein
VNCLFVSNSESFDYFAIFSWDNILIVGFDKICVWFETEKKTSLLINNDVSNSELMKPSPGEINYLKHIFFHQFVIFFQSWI